MLAVRVLIIAAGLLAVGPLVRIGAETGVLEVSALPAAGVMIAGLAA